MRGSDPDAAVYWMARMLDAGEDPRFIARRMVIFASEDVGNADPIALQVAVAAHHALEFVGLPEAKLNLSQATIYLALAPKSNASALAIWKAEEDVKNDGPLPVPPHIRDSQPRRRVRSGPARDTSIPMPTAGTSSRATSPRMWRPGRTSRRSGAARPSWRRTSRLASARTPRPDRLAS